MRITRSSRTPIVRPHRDSAMGAHYLLYSVAGELGIAIAHLEQWPNRRG